MLSMKILNWIIAFAGLWEFGDIAAVFVPGFGAIPVTLWNHISVGFLLLIVGVWAARTKHASTARSLNWIAAGAGAWLMVSAFLLRYPVMNAALWNDLIVGAVAFLLGAWAALHSAIPS